MAKIITNKGYHKPCLSSIISKLSANCRLSQQELKSLSFSSYDSLTSWMESTALSAFNRIKPGFKASSSDQGGQSTIYIDERFPFAIKEIEQHYEDMPEDDTRRAFGLSRERLGGLVTPMLILREEDTITGAAVLAVSLMDKDYISSRAGTFLDDYFRIQESYWKRGVFDHDFKLDGLGIRDGSMIVIDFGLNEDTFDERIFHPADELYWDTFHIGIYKMHVLRDDLEEMDAALGKGFEKQLREKYGLRLRNDSYSWDRGEPSIVPLAEQLRDVVRSYRPADPESNTVLPFIGGEIDNSIIKGLKGRCKG